MTVLLLCITVLGVGDSITAWDDINYLDISTHQTTNIAADFLTTGAWLTRDSDYWAGQGTFDLGHILLGTNDAIFLIEPEVVKQNILSIATQMYQYNAPIIMISLEPLAFGDAGVARNELLTQYNARISELWGEYEWVYEGIDWRNLPGIDSPDCFIDGLHPNAACHETARFYTDAAIASAVPEPNTGSLLAMGIVGLAAARRRMMA